MQTQTLEYEPVTKEQEKALTSGAHELLLWGPGGSGKTHLGTVKAIYYAITQPGNRVFLIRRKKVDLRATLWKKFTDIIPSNLVLKKDDNSMIYHISTGPDTAHSEIWGLGLDSTQDVNKLASTESGFIVLEEATEIDWAHYEEKVLRSNRLPNVDFHQVLVLCNPAAPTHWIYQRFLLQKKAHNIFMPTMPRATSLLPKWWYDEYLANLSGIFGARYRDGKWVAIEGLVYPFDPAKHVIKPFPIPKDGKLVAAIDFGFSHPFSCQWWYVSPGDVWYLYRQIYHTQRRVEEHARDIVRYCKQDGATLPQIICDHDAENIADLKHAGLHTILAQKARLAGQQAVYKLFEQDRIFFFENSLVEKDQLQQLKKFPTCVEEEFGLYTWATKGKEDMIKEFDDGMDTMRYAVFTSQFSTSATIPASAMRAAKRTPIPGYHIEGIPRL